MKIRVETQERCFTVPVPTGLVFSDATVWVACHMGNKCPEDVLEYVPPQARKNIPNQAWKELSPQDMKRLFAELRRIKKRYGSWELVEVCSADGQRVRITL